MEAFAKFGSDLDPATAAVIAKGERNVEILKQSVNSPMPVEEQIAIIYAGTQNLLREVPVNKVQDFKRNLTETLRTQHADLLQTLKAGKIDDSITSSLDKIIAGVVKNYS